MGQPFDTSQIAASFLIPGRRCRKIRGMNKISLGLSVLLFSCSPSFAQLVWDDWDRPLDLSSVTALAKSGDDLSWAEPDLGTEGWTAMPLVGNFRKSYPDWGPVVWYRFWIRLPDSPPEEPLTLKLGKIADFDLCYFNGQLVGENANYKTTPPDELFDLVREYKVPVSALKIGGGNLVAVRVDNRGRAAGGLFSPLLSLSRGYAAADRLDRSEIPNLVLNAFSFFTGLVFLFQSMGYRKERGNIFFGFFCLSLSLFFLSLLQARELFSTDYGAWMRLRYAALWAAFPLFFCFMLSFMRLRYRPLHLAYLAVTFASLPVAWFLPSVHALSWATTNLVQPSWIYPTVVIFGSLPPLARRNREGRLILVLCGIFALVLGHDILRSRALSGVLSRLPYLSSYGLLIFILGLSFLLLGRQVRLRREMDKLYLMATQDGLTGIANRIHLENFLELQIEKAKSLTSQLCVIMIDLDHFKAVNDAYGHQAGDAVLRDFGALLMRSVRPSDLAGRYGGEEFLVVLPETSPDYAFLAAERIREAQALRATELPGGTVSVTISLGVADLGSGRKTPGDLIKAADKALYAAKRAGRNRVELAPFSPDV